MAIGLGLVLVSQAGYQRSTIDPVTLELRLAVWGLGVTAIAEHPLLGLGYGDDTFAHLVKGFPQGDFILSLHNTFLTVAVGSGIPALIFLVWTLGAIVKASLRRFIMSGDPWEKGLAIGLAMVVVGFAVRNIFAYMFAGSLAYLFWVLVATGLAGKLEANKFAKGL